jgi:hypothetical protein
MIRAYEIHGMLALENALGVHLFKNAEAGVGFSELEANKYMDGRCQT